MIRRDYASESGFATVAALDMRRQPSERFQLRVTLLGSSLCVDASAARRLVVAPLARLLVGRVNERAADN